MKLKRSPWCWLLTLILLTVLLGNQIVFPGLVQAESGIEERDIFIGIGVAVLIYIIFQVGRELSSGPEGERPPVEVDPEDDLQLLAHLIHAEARGEPYRGQVAVGAVVMNRVASPDFPDTVREVIMASGQFSCVDDGQFFLQPGETAYQAAREALDGVDPSQGALFFYNPRTARNLTWFLTLEKTITIGNHVFAVKP